MAGAVSTVRTSEEVSKRGGRRPGAGRKPNYLKRLGIKAITAAEIQKGKLLLLRAERYSSRTELSGCSVAKQCARPGRAESVD